MTHRVIEKGGWEGGWCKEYVIHYIFKLCKECQYAPVTEEKKSKLKDFDSLTENEQMLQFFMTTLHYDDISSQNLPNIDFLFDFVIQM